MKYFLSGKMKSKVSIEGRKFYDEQLKAILEPEHNGQYVSIEPESGQYFLGKTGGQALAEGNKIFPDKILYLARIGFPSAYKMGFRSLSLFKNKDNFQ